MLDRLLSVVPGTRAHARHAAITDKIVALGQALREPLTDPATTDLAVAQIATQPVEDSLVSAYQVDRPPATSLAETASAWAEALSVRSYMPLGREQLQTILLGMAQQLADGAPGELPMIASRIGRELGQHVRVTPQAFEDLLELLIPWIEHRHLRRDSSGLTLRTKTFAALAGGFAAGTRERVFDEQIALNDSLQTTHQRRREQVLVEPVIFQELLATSDQPLALMDRRGTIRAANAAARDLLALGDGDGTFLLEDCAFSEADCLTIRTLLDDIITAETIHLEFAVAWPEGSFKAWVNATLRWHRGTEHNPGRVCAVFDDATPSYAWRRLIDNLANRDEVTDLPSRRSFLLRAQTTLDSASRHNDATVGLCAIRLVGLTRITRELGPQHGNALIIALAARITGAVSGTPGATTARLDRDTFAVLLTDNDSWASVGDMVKRISAWLSDPVRSGNHNLTVTPRVGVAEARRGTITASELLARAEAALDTETTITRRPWTIIEDTHTTQQHHRTRLIAALPGAVANNELTLTYSPIAGIQAGAIVGLHVHTTWHHPEHGDLLIDDLVGLADDLGLTLPLCRWALEQSARHAATWRRMFRASAPFVLLTIPQRLADDETLVEHVRDALTASGLPPHLLWLAIPGNAMLDEHHTVRPHLTGLDTMGVGTLLDGVGTTFTHYHRLPDLPINGLVLPPELTAGLRNAPDRRKPRALTHAFITVAADLGLTTLLRGLTTPDQLHDARLTTADLAQGDVIGRPLPVDDIDALLYDRPADLPHNRGNHPSWTL